VIKLGESVEAGLVGLDDPKKTVALKVTVLLKPRMMVEDASGHLGTDCDGPCPSQDGRLDRGGHQIRSATNVVAERPVDRERSLPTDRVSNEARFAGGEKGLEFSTTTGSVKPTPGDRMEAAIPVPLPRVGRGTRYRKGVVLLAIIALSPVLQEERSSGYREVIEMLAQSIDPSTSRNHQTQ
jgi:hypothetical protein